jgi:hypothetical protein
MAPTPPAVGAACITTRSLVVVTVVQGEVQDAEVVAVR